jgi:hypothetical protein
MDILAAFADTAKSIQILWHHNGITTYELG